MGRFRCDNDLLRLFREQLFHFRLFEFHIDGGFVRIFIFALELSVRV